MSGQGTCFDEANDPEQLRFDLESIREFSQPVLLTLGDQSPPIFAPVVAKLIGALPRVELLTFPGAGHIPHATDPEAYVEAIIAFTRKHPA
jgi:pimeloyl-ACP methyl ester carboxylesterase